MARLNGTCEVLSRPSSLQLSTQVRNNLSEPFEQRIDPRPGSQVILYFTGGSLGFIEEDLGLSRGSAWLPTANILAIAAACPYAGYLQDLFGKRYIALFGSLCICIGCALVASGHTFAQLLVGMALSGVGAAVGELTGLAGYVLIRTFLNAC